MRWEPETFMARLPVQTAEDLMLIAEQRDVPAGKRILAQGGTTSDVFLLAARGRSAACVKITAGLANGAETLLGVRVTGDIVGEIAAIRGSSRSATVIACTSLRVYKIPGLRFRAFLDTHPVAWQALTCVLADRLDAANRRRLDFGAFPVEIRLARVLTELANRHGRDTDDGMGRDLGVKLTQAELGRVIGAGPDSASNAVRRLKNTGLVRPTYRGIVITDIGKLESMAAAGEPDPRVSQPGERGAEP